MSTATQAIPEGKYVEVGEDRTIHYHEAGTGYPVIFVHGSGPGASGYSNFKGNYRAVADAGFQALVPDLLGYGYSSMPSEAKYTFEGLVDGLRTFCAELGIERCALVGNSLGGALAIQLALDTPELVDKLILMAPGGLEEREAYMGMKGIRTMIKAMTAPEGITRDSLRKIFSLQLYDSSLVTEEIVEERYQIAVQQPQGIFEKLVVPNLGERLAEISCPILGFWGMDDQFCPTTGAMKIAENCQNTKMTLLTECGHWVMVEHADYFNRQCAAFLDEERTR